jgi:hypothetical protein
VLATIAGAHRPLEAELALRELRRHLGVALADLDVRAEDHAGESVFAVVVAHLLPLLPPGSESHYVIQIA